MSDTCGDDTTQAEITVEEAVHGTEPHQRDLGEHPGNLLVRYPSNTDPDSYTMTERDADHNGLVERYITAHQSDYVVIRR